MKWLGTLGTKQIVRQARRLPVPAALPRPRLALEALEDRCLPSTGVSEFALPGLPPRNSANPAAITAGPDGNLWFTDQSAQAVGRITPAGAITEYPAPVAVGTFPTASHQITAGPDGNLWFTEYRSSFQHTGFPNLISESKIAKITPAGVITEFPLPDPASAPLGITVGPDGRLWFTESRANKIGSITTDGTIQEFTIPKIDTDFTTRLTAIDITAGPDGNLWYTELNDKVGRIAPNGASLGELKLSRVPAGITTGPDGNVWVAETNAIFSGGSYLAIFLNSASVARITPAGAVTEFPLLVGTGAALDAITAGPDGNLWFTEDNFGDSNPKIGSIRTDGSLVAEVPISRSTVNPGITVGARGDIWFTEFFAGKIGVVHNYVETLYERVLGRPASQAEQHYWADVGSRSGQAAVADGIQRSDEAHADLVQGWYRTYLGRQADAGGLQYFVTLLRTATEEQALARMLASPEYYNYAPSVAFAGTKTPTDQAFVLALYRQLLDRDAGADEAAYWQTQVATRGREAAVLQLTAADEYRANVILDAYLLLLRRRPFVNAGEVAYWVSLTRAPQNSGLPGGPEGGPIAVPLGAKLDLESIKVLIEQTEEFALNGNGFSEPPGSTP
jgi:streptogramin lyase